MTLSLSHADLADKTGLIASIGALLPVQPFSRTEQIVIDIAWNEGQRAHARANRLNRVMNRVFGWRPPMPLGSEKLEALRQYGMLTRRLGARAVPAAATAALMAAGYGAEHISVLQMTFSAFRGGIVAHGRKGM